MRSTLARSLTLSVAALLALTACSGNGDGDDIPADDAAVDASAPDDEAEEAPDVVGEGGDAPAMSRGTATITFGTGDTLSTDVACVLEPQVAAGQEILYTATSQGSPYFDLTVFGEDAAISGATVSWDETDDFETYQESWSAGITGDFEAELDGNTITGSGTFMRGDDAAGQEGETREGEVEVVCGQ